MERTLLKFENIQQVVGSEELSVILLTDESRQRVLSVVCDADMSRQIVLRLSNPDLCTHYLPEVLMKVLPFGYEMMVVGLYNGQYQVVLMDAANGVAERIRMSDAVLLSLISNTPLYIEERLMQRQSVPFDANAKGVALPINALDMPRLKMALTHAVEEENYELASQLRDEINRRSGEG